MNRRDSLKLMASCVAGLPILAHANVDTKSTHLPMNPRLIHTDVQWDDLGPSVVMNGTDCYGNHAVEAIEINEWGTWENTPKVYWEYLWRDRCFLRYHLDANLWKRGSAPAPKKR